jgi:hypothetical protein
MCGVGMNALSVLSKHIGHTLVMGSGSARCETCSVDLDWRESNPHPHVNDPERCRVHLDSIPCRGCAADRLVSEVSE